MGKLQTVRGRGVSKKGAPPGRERACDSLKSASAASALATIPAAVAFTDFAPHVFILTCTPQASAVSALILGLLDHALPSYGITR
jgi:hypothetical protein